jgi:lipopolysaccharide transport system ATP-binding protein
MSNLFQKMSTPVIQVENISKAYQIGQIGTGTISRDLERFVATKIFGKPDPFLKIGETNSQNTKANSDIVWCLQDINFEINQGDAVAIIGKNGAGKSTLLKLLSRVTSPTTGQIKVKGRIASLLEVGTGFHPELSGRENIYLNGAILGMRKKEITRKLDEIIDFSGVERYVDTPVKRYSSGMYVRLAFAVAANLESEILIVDEVLAVGDAEFQKKCLGKMGDISKGEGRTVLFVSHNMAAVQSLCTKGIVLNNGKVQFTGNISNSVSNYLRQYSNELVEINYALEQAPGSDFAKFTHASVINANKTKVIYEGDAIEIQFEFYVLQEGFHQLGITFHLYDEMGVFVFMGSSCNQERLVSKGFYREKVTIPANLMQEGTYNIPKLLLVLNKGTGVCIIKNVLEFEILPAQNESLGWKGQKEGAVKPKLEWNIIHK